MYAYAGMGGLAGVVGAATGMWIESALLPVGATAGQAFAAGFAGGFAAGVVQQSILEFGGAAILGTEVSAERILLAGVTGGVTGGITAGVSRAIRNYIAGRVTNPVPRRMARVVPAQYAESPTLAAPGAQEAFVTAAEDITGITTSRGLAERLTLIDEAGNLIEGPFVVFEFDTPVSGVASPVFRSSPGFVGRGLTAGGAREFTIPNLPLAELKNLTIRIVQ